ncbi:MAG: hypothetical protein U9P61_02630 [Patescibacteria group bacterium]|nr:hypothetical protein [Patescibacteria group bacterium]
MKILIAYYSRTKEIEKLAERIEEKLKKEGHSVDVEKIIPAKEHDWFFWFFLRIFKGECDIEPLKIKDATDYDLVLVGSPNWTRLSLPVARYLKEIKGIMYKNVALFSTTFAPPTVERYSLSGYLLDFNFNKIVEKKGGRAVDTMLISSAFKKWGVDSDYGKERISRFCRKATSSVVSFKDYFLKRKEVQNFRFLIILFSFLLLLILVLRVAFDKIIADIILWRDFSVIVIILFFAFIILTLIRNNKKLFFLGKYISSFSVIFAWTLFIFYLSPELGMGRLMMTGYIFIFVLFSSFRDEIIVAFSGLIVLLGYISLFCLLTEKEFFNIGLDMGIIAGSCFLFVWFTGTFRNYYSVLLDAQDEVEKSRRSLEEKVKLKTKELNELNEGLEKEVEKRTSKIEEQKKELKKKVDYLERFGKITVGREVKMKDLKEEIEVLKREKEELEERKDIGHEPNNEE